MSRNLCLALVGTAALLTLGAQAQMPPALKYEPRLLRSAVQAYLTPRGQKLFDTGLEKLLLANGLSFREGEFPEIERKADKPLRLEDLKAPMKDHQQTLAELRDLLKKWLLGFEFNDPWIHAHIKDISYKADFTKLSLRFLKTDRSADGREGVLARFALVVPSVQINIGSIRVRDANNEFLGEFGVNQLWARTSKDSEPLTLALDFLVYVQKDGKLGLESRELKTNLATINLETGFTSPLILPVVKLQINDRVMTLNPAPVEEMLLEMQPKLIAAAQAYLSTAVERELPKRVAGLSDKVFGGDPTEYNRINPPGMKRDFKVSEKYVWGLRLQKAFLTSNSNLKLEAMAFLEDPLLRKAAPVPSAREPQPVEFTALDPKDFDAAIGIHPIVFQRLIQLSYNRGYFQSFEVSDGEKIEVADMPQIVLSPSTKPGTVRLRATIKATAGKVLGEFLNNVLFKEKVKVTIETVIRIGLKAGKPYLYAEEMDASTLSFDEGALQPWTRALAGTARRQILKVIEKQNAKLRSERKNLIQNFEMPSSLVGTQIQLKALTTEPRSGNIVAYLNFTP